MRKPAAHTAEEGEDVEIETRQIVDREMRGPVDAGGGLRRDSFSEVTLARQIRPGQSI